MASERCVAFLILFLVANIDASMREDATIEGYPRNFTHEKICREAYAGIVQKDRMPFPYVHQYGVGFEKPPYDEMKIVFRVFKKMPKHWLGNSETIPKNIGGCRTQVIESPPSVDHGRLLTGGTPVTTFDFNVKSDKIEGVIGLIQKTKDNELEGITSLHVVVVDATKPASGGRVVLPPASPRKVEDLVSRDADVIGTVARNRS